MTEAQPIYHCKNCSNWPVPSIKFPCRACTNEGRSARPYPGEKMRNYYKRHKDIPIYTQAKTIEDKRKEMGLQ